MTEKQKQWLAYAIVVVAILVAGFLGVTYPVPAPPVVVSSQGFTYPPGAIYFAAGGKSQVFQDGSSATFNSGAQLTASSGSTVTLSGANTVTAPTFTGLPIQSSANYTPTEGTAYAPTAGLVTLTPAGALTFTLSACTSGQFTVLYNSVNASVIITDSTNFLAAGDQTLGQYDALQAACIGSKWVQVSAASAN